MRKEYRAIKIINLCSTRPKTCRSRCHEFSLLTSCKNTILHFLKNFQNYFKDSFAYFGTHVAPRAQIITFQKMASKFMEALTGLLRFYFKKFDVLLVYDLSIKIKRILIICLKYKMSMQINRSR